jgi:indole-3-glycerol phosphate synthase
LTILEKIFATKREEVRLAKSLVSPYEMRAKALDCSPRRGFLQALKTSSLQPSLIAEVKRASPSQGEIVTGDFDPVGIAKTYEASGAACLSVLTDVEYFHGSPEYLRPIRAAVEIPLLRKDFMFDEYQLDEAIVWGADCILLIVAGLETDNLKRLYEIAKERGLDVLVEVHNEEETVAALELKPDLVGINNRDLSTFETDIVTTQRLINMIPKGVLKVSESALHSRSDVQLVQSYGADAVLIGTAFCGSPNIAAKVREVMVG